jgi:[acyl-carrier-protein] S-malonyltransferase
MGGLAFLFPGQGTQQAGMGKDLYLSSNAARKVLDKAEGLMPGLKRLCFEGPMEQLTRTDIAQPALFAVESACAAAALEIGIRPDAMAGFSLGEWAACHAAGMLSFEEAFSLVRRRGEWMQAAAVKHPGGMSAVLRLSAREVKALAAEHPGVYAVNFNGPEQTVVAGPIEALELFEKVLRDQGVRSVRLNVGGAFHSPLMQEAAELLSKALAEANLRPTGIPVYSNLTALPYQQGDARETLARQTANPVRWEETVRNMASHSIGTFLELGPGKVLCGLVQKMLPGAKTFQAEDADSLRGAAAALKGRA